MSARLPAQRADTRDRRDTKTLLRHAIRSAYLHAKILLDRVLSQPRGRASSSHQLTLLGRILHAKVDTLHRFREYLFGENGQRPKANSKIEEEHRLNLVVDSLNKELPIDLVENITVTTEILQYPSAPAPAGPRSITSARRSTTRRTPLPSVDTHRSVQF